MISAHMTWKWRCNIILVVLQRVAQSDWCPPGLSPAARPSSTTWWLSCGRHSRSVVWFWSTTVPRCCTSPAASNFWLQTPARSLQLWLPQSSFQSCRLLVHGILVGIPGTRPVRALAAGAVVDWCHHTKSHSVQLVSHTSNAAPCVLLHSHRGHVIPQEKETVAVGERLQWYCCIQQRWLASHQHAAAPTADAHTVSSLASLMA